MPSKRKDLTFMRAVGRRVVETRESLPRPVNQSQLAALLKVKAPTLANWEAGTHLFPVLAAVEWQRLLLVHPEFPIHLSLDWLYVGHMNFLDYPLQRAILRNREIQKS